jgi:plasmid maintenance system antidote protein VapI
MNEKITVENFKNFLASYMEAENISMNKVAKAINCPETSIGRILVGKTWPSDEMMKQCAIMIEIGFKNYKKLTDAQKEKISESIGTISAGGLGFASITAAVSASGAVVGLSAAGIASGLAAIGATVGGGMVAGITLVAAIPIVAGVAGYGIVKGIKKAILEKKINQDGFEPKWERPLEE